MKNIIALIAVFALLVFVGFSDTDNTTSKTIIYNDAVVTGTGEIVSAWIPVGNSEQVSIWLYVDDTADVTYYTDYRYGTETEITLAIDSIETTGTALTGKSKGIPLRGFGASAITNLIPGANQVRFRTTWNTGSETSIKIHAGINY